MSSRTTCLTSKGGQRVLLQFHPHPRRPALAGSPHRRGAVMVSSDNMVGITFGRLLVLEESTPRNGRRHYLCRCSCGKEKSISAKCLRNGDTKSCGCLQIEIASRPKSHGMSYTRTYRSWSNMVQRSTNANNERFKDYGGRGVGICKRWLTFSNFLYDMGEAPEGMEIDRINNNKGYAKGNCRWATPTQNNRNKRSNFMVKYKGQTKCISEWAEITGIKRATLRHRLVDYGWPVHRAMTQPVSGSAA